MDIRKPPTEREVAEWLKESRIGLPPMRFQFNTTQPRYETADRWDFELEGTWADQKSLFVVEYKSLSTPKAFEEGAPTLPACQAAAWRWPLVLVPYLRPSQLEELEQLGVSGMDLCGNGVVIVPGAIRIFRTGQPNRFSLTAPIKNIYRKNTSMVARIFTAVPRFPTVSAICDEINARNPFIRNNLRTPMGLGTVSKALKSLEEDLIIERSDTIGVLQAEKLLTQLEQNYEPPKPTRKRSIKVLLTGLKLLCILGERLQGIPTPAVATGLSSIGKYAVMAREEIISLYCSHIDLVQKQLKGTETDRFPNVELIETEEEPFYFDARMERGFAWASPLQTYLELMAGDKRDQETADQVKTLLLRTTK